MPYTKFKVLDIIEICPFRKDGPNHEIKPIPMFRLLEIPVPKKIPGHIVVWIDKNIDENFKAFSKITSRNNLTDFDLIQLISNEHFEIWLDEFKHILSLP